MVTHYRLRLYLLALLVLGMFSILVVRLYRIQIIEHAQYVKKLPGRRFESIRIPGIRGEIKDRNGIVLAESVRNFELHFDLKIIVTEYVKKHGSTPKREWNRYRNGQPIIEKETDIVAVVEEMVFPGLAKLGLLADYSSSHLRVHYRSTRGVVPFTYRRDITLKELARFSENNLGIPGVTVTRTGQRNYVYDSLAGHMLGYLNLPDIEKVDKEQRAQYNHYVGDDYGVQGLEKTMDHYLQGKAGKQIIEKNEKGKFVGEVSRTEPQPGSDVYLTIDANVQMITEQALRKIGRGAAVVIDPNNGDILAMASVPSFNPNEFIPNISAADYKKYDEDPTAPIFNRAVNPYSPGSTMKVPISLSGCLGDSWKYRFPCGKGAQYGSKFMKCWCYSKGYSHGSVDIGSALKYSCNGFYYRFANHTGIRNIQTMSNLLGLGEPTGIEVTGEKGGNIPNPEWLRMQGLLWSDAFTALVSIGQGATECTPLQMASVTASSCNGGIVYRPRLVKKIVEKNGEIVSEEPPKIRADLTKEGLTANQVETVKKGMWRVVNESGGTAGRAASDVTVLSGKTGTTQTGNPRQPTNAWFIAFAPYDKPKYAVCVFVENGNSGGGAASPIAKNIIERSILHERGLKPVELAALEPAVGNFDRVMSVSFDGNLDVIVDANEVADEAAEAVDVADFVPTKLKKRTTKPVYSAPKPTIRKEVDAGGSVSGRNQQQPKRFQPFKNLFKRNR